MFVNCIIFVLFEYIFLFFLLILFTIIQILYIMENIDVSDYAVNIPENTPDNEEELNNLIKSMVLSTNQMKDKIDQRSEVF